jgi:hypothetical protein
VNIQKGDNKESLSTILMCIAVCSLVVFMILALFIGDLKYMLGDIGSIFLFFIGYKFAKKSEVSG